MKRLSLLLSMVLFVASMAFAQRTVTGTITDAKSGEPLVGASVVVKGKPSIGAIADIDGKYALSIPKDGDALIFTFTGYTSKEVALGASNVVDLALEESAILLNESVITALGIAKEDKALGYAQQQVSGDKLASANTLSAIDALAGKAAGVQITSSSGSVGASSRIVLRGNTSFGDNQALIVIDGMKIDNSERNTENNLQGVAQSNRAIDINPNDIESITVLKGASASALYGIDGARGVILINTKKGASKKGKGISIDYSTNYTTSEANKFLPLQNKFSQGLGGIGAGSSFTPVDGAQTSASWGAKVDTLFYDGVANEFNPNGRLVGKSNSAAKTNLPAQVYNPYDIFQTGHAWQNNLSLSANLNENSSIRFSFGNNREVGTIPNSKYDRTTMSIGSRSGLFDNRLKINTSLNYTLAKSKRIQQGSNISGLMLGLVRTPPTFDNTNGVSDPVNNNKSYLLSNGAQRAYRQFIDSDGNSGNPIYDNPYWVVNRNPYNDEVNRFFGNIDITYDLIPKYLMVNAKVGTDIYSDARKQAFDVGSSGNPDGLVIDDKYVYRNYDAFLSLLGSADLNSDLNVSYTVGTNIYQNRLKNSTITGTGLTIPSFYSVNNAAAVNATFFNDEQRSQAVYGNVDFGYKSFLYLTLTGRNDWVSNLVKPNQPLKMSDISFFYPSVATSFVFSELLPQNQNLNFGKLRLSYGQVGGGAPQAYLTSTNFIKPTIFDGWVNNGIPFPYQGKVGYSLTDTKGNDFNLRPSRTTDYEIGIETKLFKNRVSLEASYYTRVSKDQILPVPIPSTTGFDNFVVNAGQISTKGYDVVLGLTPVKGKFTWDVNFNFTTWKSVVDKLADGVSTSFVGGFTGSAIFNVAGQEFGQIYGNAYQRANDPTGTKFDAALPYNPKGALLISDDGYPMIDGTGSRPVGNPNPDFLLGINNSFSYKGFILSALIDIKYGSQMWNGTRGALSNFGTSQETEVRDQGAIHVFEGIVASTGQPNTKAVARNQAYWRGVANGFTNITELYVEDSGFARLRQLNLAYRFGGEGLKKAGFSDLTLNFIGRNLWLKTNYTGIDPETSLAGSTNAQGLDYFNNPGTKSYAFGLSVKF